MLHSLQLITMYPTITSIAVDNNVFNHSSRVQILAESFNMYLQDSQQCHEFF